MKGMDKMTAGRVQLLFSYVFFGVLATNMRLIESESVPTAATDGRSLIFNPKFTDPLTKEQVLFVIAHEVLHLVLLSHVRMGNKDRKVWNMACITLDNSILMSDGTSKPMWMIQPGDEVMSPLGPNKVLGISYNGEREVGMLNSSLRCTLDHKVLTDEGFKEAESCTDRGVYVHPEARDAAGGIRQLRNTKPISISSINQYQIQGNSRISADQRVEGRSVCDQEKQHEAIIESEGAGPGVFSGANRRGGNYISTSDTTGSGQRKTVSEALTDYHEHIIFSPEVFGESGILWDCECQQLWASLLENSTGRVCDKGLPSQSRTFLDREETCLSSSNRAMRRAYEAAKERPSDSSYVEACRRNKGFELEKGFFQQREGDIQPVFDLITEKGAYIAEGVVVHNCDYAINLILKDEGMHLLEGILVDEKYRDWSAEKIYSHLMDNPEEQPGNGDGGGWNIGEVMPAGSAGEEGEPGSGQPMTTEQLEAEAAGMKAKIQAAAMAAKKAGVMSAGMDRLIEEICAPKANWKEILQRFVKQLAMSDWDYSKCHTRMLHSYGIISPVIGGHTVGHLALIVDTSGSVDEKQLAQFAGEISDILESYECEVTVIYIDTKINRVDTYTQDDLPLKLHAVGGGGTKASKAYEYIAEELDDVEAIIHYTDTYVADWDQIEYPGCPALVAHTSDYVDRGTPDWMERIDIS